MLRWKLDGLIDCGRVGRVGYGGMGVVGCELWGKGYQCTGVKWACSMRVSGSCVTVMGSKMFGERGVDGHRKPLGEG